MHESPRRPLRYELVFVILVSVAVLLPGIWRYSLVDPWETHYGEVARMMLQDHDPVHMQWPQDGEGFRSKPILQFWMMAASLRAAGVATNGGYSGEMIDDGARTMFAIRLPFVLSAIAGLTLMWWMLARLVNRRLAWLALLVVGSCPFYCLVARQAMPDMPLVACVMGAIAMFMMAVEDGEAPIAPLWRVRLGRRQVSIDARHLVLAVAGGSIAVQALYYAAYFWPAQQLAVPGVHHLVAAIALPALMLLALAAMWSPLWHPLVSVANRLRRWPRIARVVDRLVRVAAITRMRQVYLLWFYWLIGVSILAKGPPGLAVVGLVAFFHVALLNRWRALYDGAFEIKRGLILLVATFLPWHLAMWWKDGNHFIDEYLFMHILNRATVGVDNSVGTFEMYASQIGYGMWIWAALLPAAIAGAFLRTRLDSRAGRVRFMAALWAISGVAFFAMVQTKFHHYILPAIPALAILVAFFLDDVLAKRDRLHPLLAAIGIAIVLFVARDLMFEPKRWIEMFVFLYNRPWPSGEPWSIDPSDGFLALGLVAAVAIAALACFRRIGVAGVAAAAIAICLWGLHAYMPVAGRHWGMREALATYYHQRTIYGAKHVYWGTRELYDDWHDHGDRWRYETMIPDTLQLGQPMTITVQVMVFSEKKTWETQTLMPLVGTATAIGDHDVEITLAPGERERLAPLIAKGKDGPRGQPPVRVIDADKLLAWQLYWRGENFWSADEIVGPIPEMHTAFKNADNVEIMKYLHDRTLAPIGRRYFVVSTAGQLPSMRSIIPTQRGKDSFEIIDTTSNKFSMAAFDL